MKYLNGELVFDKAEAAAIEEHIHNYGLSSVGLKIVPDMAERTIDFIGQSGITLRFKLSA
jgi:hypothetical protein